MRKAPQISAIGFRQSATKLLTVVDLLMGDIPERARFLQKNLEKSLQVNSRSKNIYKFYFQPYFHLTQSVRTGNLAEFNKGNCFYVDLKFFFIIFAVLEKYGANFKNDRTYTLILRLRHNVIKTGIRRISLSYSKF